MRYGTYACSLADGGTEYGFTFGAAGNDADASTDGPCEIGDSEFDVVLGVEQSDKLTDEIKAKWTKYEWVAKAIIAASKLEETP